MFLLDTNIWLELILGQEKADEYTLTLARFDSEVENWAKWGRICIIRIWAIV